MQLNEFMASPVFACKPNTTMQDAARDMARHNVGSLVVEDGAGICGIVTDRDIALSIGRGAGPQAPVEEVMSREVTTIGIDVDVPAAARIMRRTGYWRLPVVDHEGHALGMVSLGDLVTFVAETSMDLSTAVLAHGHPQI